MSRGLDKFTVINSAPVKREVIAHTMNNDLAIMTQRANDNLHQITRIEQITEDGHKGYIFTLKSGKRLHPIFPIRDHKPSKYPRSFTYAEMQSIHQLLCEYFIAHNESFNGLLGKMVSAEVGDRALYMSKRRTGSKASTPELGFTHGYTIDLVKAFDHRLRYSLEEKEGRSRPLKGKNCTLAPFITNIPIYEMLFFTGRKPVSNNTIRLAGEFDQILIHWTPEGTIVYEDKPSDDVLSPDNIIEVFEQHFKARQQKYNYKVDWSLGEKEAGFYLYPKDNPTLIMCKERQTHVSYRATTANDYDRIVHYVVTFIGFPIYHPTRDDDSSKIPVKSINTANAWGFKRW